MTTNILIQYNYISRIIILKPQALTKITKNFSSKIHLFIFVKIKPSFLLLLYKHYKNNNGVLITERIFRYSLIIPTTFRAYSLHSSMIAILWDIIFASDDLLEQNIIYYFLCNCIFFIFISGIFFYFSFQEKKKV